uniref:Uncharacterized protein n=1 Tax=Coccidioides posadasii RMSCC 3488 TaxID=454284 RepID=A0A0J6F8L1_COCPO|nr:hypothetical protein CPAG_01635 [Coccidioides posadasii RMSCC 3488]
MEGLLRPDWPHAKTPSPIPPAAAAAAAASQKGWKQVSLAFPWLSDDDTKFTACPRSASLSSAQLKYRTRADLDRIVILRQPTDSHRTTLKELRLTTTRRASSLLPLPPLIAPVSHPLALLHH